MRPDIFGRFLRKMRSVSGTSHANTYPFFAVLSDLGFSPKHVVDVGAHQGAWTRTAMRFFPNSRFSLFEPQRGLLESQSDFVRENVRLHFLGVGAESGTATLSLHNRPDSVSFALSSDQAQLRGFDQIEAPVVALDDFFRSESADWPEPDVLNIDAEGWDLEVIAGATEVIDHCEVVLVEAGVLNKGFTNTGLVVMFEMHNRGFTLFDTTDLNRTQKHGALWNVELAFVKEGGILDQQVLSYS